MHNALGKYISFCDRDAEMTARAHHPVRINGLDELSDTHWVSDGFAKYDGKVAVQ